MSDALTALAGIGIVALFAVLIVAAYRSLAREERRLEERELRRNREWTREQADNIERRARRHQ